MPLRKEQVWNAGELEGSICQHHWDTYPLSKSSEGIVGFIAGQ